MREDVHSDYGRQLNPTASLGYLCSHNVKVFGTIGRSFRAPSYTELFYTSPSRVGNAGLKPETGWSYELGWEYTPHPDVRVTTSVFQRDQENIIDYVKYTSTDIVYRATNFASIVTRGVEASFQWNGQVKYSTPSMDRIALHTIYVSYTYLDSRIDLGNIFKTIYSLTYPQHQISATFSGVLPFLLNGTASATHKIKLDGKSFTLVDARLSRLFSPITVFLQGTNLLNQSYEEIVGVPLPGRWLWAGIEFKIM
jgi:iron complex outermembrane receptor protein